jgi:hypothetical protein
MALPSHIVAWLSLEARQLRPAQPPQMRGAFLLFRLPFPALVGWRRRIGRRAYDAFMQVWGQTNVSDLYDRANAEEGAAAELRRFRELETEEEAAFSSLLATRPATKASAIACVKHVADCGLATSEMRAWLAMMVESPLAS